MNTLALTFAICLVPATAPISDKDLTANPNLVQNPGYATLK